MDKCRECGKEVSTEAKVCPHCGVAKPVKKSMGIRGWLAVAVVGVIAYNVAKPGDPPATQATKKPVEHQAATLQAAVQPLEVRCTTGIQALITDAQQDISMGRPNYAVDTLSPCEKYFKGGEAKAVLAKAKAAVIEATNKQKRDAKALAAKKKKEGVSLGMSPQDVYDSQWGRPEKVNRTTNTYGTREQWVYPGGNYLYFEDGVLTSIQN